MPLTLQSQSHLLFFCCLRLLCSLAGAFTRELQTDSGCRDIVRFTFAPPDPNTIFRRVGICLRKYPLAARDFRENNLGNQVSAINFIVALLFQLAKCSLITREDSSLLPPIEDSM